MRLVNGTVDREGRFEICAYGVWSRVCAQHLADQLLRLLANKLIILMLKVCIIKFKLYLYVHACNTFDSKTFHYALIKRYILFDIEIITGD